jgi:hypothetical protein
MCHSLHFAYKNVYMIFSHHKQLLNDGKYKLNHFTLKSFSGGMWNQNSSHKMFVSWRLINSITHDRQMRSARSVMIDVRLASRTLFLEDAGFESRPSYRPYRLKYSWFIPELFWENTVRVHRSRIHNSDLALKSDNSVSINCCISHHSVFRTADHSGRAVYPRHEPSSLSRTLESPVRVPLKTWMSVCVYSVFVSFCV